MHVDGGEAGAIEGRAHLHLTVDALLAQDGDLGPHALLDVGGADVLVGIIGQLGRQTRMILFQ